jgi:hypothetical protein
MSSQWTTFLPFLSLWVQCHLHHNFYTRCCRKWISLLFQLVSRTVDNTASIILSTNILVLPNCARTDPFPVVSLSDLPVRHHDMSQLLFPAFVALHICSTGWRHVNQEPLSRICSYELYFRGTAHFRRRIHCPSRRIHHIKVATDLRLFTRIYKFSHHDRLFLSKNSQCSVY